MKKYLASLSAALVMVLALALPITSFAASSVGSSGLSITPRKNLIIKPGSSLTDQLSISNLSQQSDLQVNIRVIDFTFSGTSGSPKLFLAKDHPQTPWSLKPFLSVPESKVVPAGQTKTVNYTVKIPKNQGAGSYYSAIVYSTGGNSGGNVNLSASGVTLMFVDVPGIVKEDMTLQKFGAFGGQSAETGSYNFINTTEPRRMAFMLKNNGNVAEAPSGSITLSDMWGNKVTTIDKVNPRSSLAIIGQTRQFVVCIKSKQKDVDLSGQNATEDQCQDPNLSPGRYTASLDLFYGQNGNQTKEIQGTTTFWYIPWWLIAAIIAAILIIIWIIVSIKRKIRRAKSGKYKAGHH